MIAIERAWRGGRGEWRMHALSALSSAAAFLCLAFALLAVFNLNGLEQRWAAAGRITAYLAPRVSEQQAGDLTRTLRATPGVAEARYVSAENARTELLDATPNALLATLPQTAFPASIEVQLVEGATSDRSDEVAERLRELPSIEFVETYAAWTSRLSRFAGAATLCALLLSAIVFAAVASVVSSSIKLMLERRRAEVEVLRVIGATTAYVRRPFMLEGAAQGALGALFAVILCAVMFNFVTQRFDEQLALLLGMAPRFLPWFVSLAMVALGASLGAAAASLSLRGASEV